MAVAFSMDEARDRLTELLDRAEAGEDVVITRSGAPAVVLERVPAGPDLTGDLGATPAFSFDMGTDYGLNPAT